MSEPSKTIPFRLPAAFARDLENQAAARGLTKSAYLRAIVTEALTHAERDELRSKLNDIEQLVADLRHKLATATAGILTDLQTIPKNNPKEEKLSAKAINAWVRDNIL